MRVRYLHAQARQPIPSLHGSLIRPRAVMPIRIIGSSGSWLTDAVLDTGSDDSVFEAWIAAAIGIDLTHAEGRDLGIVGRPQPVRCRYASVRLRITDGGQETYEWPAVVGFVGAPLRYPGMLGFAGFFQFFDAHFLGRDLEVILTANSAFPTAMP